MYLDSESKTRLTSLNVDGPFAGSARRKTERTNKMKKLMIAAAVAAMTAGAFAAEAEETVCNEKCPFGYQIKVALKTTSTLSVSNRTTECKEYCFRGPASLRLAGFVWGITEEDGDDPCGEKGCKCNAWDGAKIQMWNYDTHAAAQFTAMAGLQLDRIFSRNLDSTMVEIAFDLDQLRFAGFGYVAKRNGKWTIKNLAGFCAGVLPQECRSCSETDPCTEECKAWDDTAPVKVWGICDSEAAAPSVESPTTAAYGKWTLDWSAAVYQHVYDKDYSAEAGLRPGQTWGTCAPIDFTFTAN